ncbi:MAG: GAF domain-containing sensor histidine kinase [Anaerolineae bacterium]|uniref:sensor histidine kinase n=1 Tax=Promineifilum sp. TaxID=2664178 RepID=UPI001DABED88|nr:GAF domain-containing sensor histidine kinase [Anaerolineales bacterium]MCB8934358.1 GAF domain-containing sensor histidine kinase [Promineifilum sp.]MCO5180315.1 GAF domain-containing sensor histidine kinase [Promineifilum sp.]MCW5847319.1 GAF domain-containing sensor histidine kinase [Anaerolineae bacterium]
MTEFFDRNLVVIYFFYGLAFFSMGLAIWLASSRFRTSELRLAGALLFLAGYGIVHGLQEWFDMFRLLDERGSTLIPAWLLLHEVHLTHLVISFLLLVFFGIKLLFANRREGENGDRLALLGAGAFLLLWLVSVGLTWWVYRPERLVMINAADALARYTLGITGAIIAAWAIWLEQREFEARGMGRFGRSLLGAAVVLLLYGIIGQVFVTPSFIFPSTVINSDLFLDLFGFPVELLRAVLAILMAVFIIRALNAFEIENQRRLADAVEQRVAAQRQALRVQQQARADTEQLNHQLQNAVQDLALLFNISRRMAGTLDRSTLLKDAVPLLVDMLPAVSAGMLVLRRVPRRPLEIVSIVECSDPAASVAERKEQGLQLAEYTATTGRASWMVQHAVEPLDEPGMTDGTGGDASALSELATTSTAAAGHTMAMPLRARGAIIGSLVFCTLYDAPPFSLRDVALARAIADQLSVAIDNATLYDELQQSGKLRGELLHRVVSAQEAERQRIARELHDGTGQTLTALGLGLAAAADRLDSDPAAVRRQLADMKQMNAQVLQEVHNVISDLRPSILDSLGLIPALRGHVNTFETRTGIQTQLIVQGKSSRLKPEVETTIFRVVQESLTNVVRHAQARSVLVQVIFGADGVELSVHDDGRGFDVTRALAGEDGRAAWGLLGIQERASLVGGTAELVSAPNEGTIVRVSIPQPFKEEHNG